MPVPQRGTQAEVGIRGLFWIRSSSGPVFHSKSGPLCHPAHRGVMLSQQDILPPLHHPHPACTRHPFIPRKGTKLICFHSYSDIGSMTDLWSWWLQVQYSCRQPCKWLVKLPFLNKTNYILFGYFLWDHSCFSHLWLLTCKSYLSRITKLMFQDTVTNVITEVISTD